MSGHVHERLGPYMDGELEEAERRMVLAHLAECTLCSRLLAEMALVDEAARSLPVPAKAEYFQSFPGRVKARLAPRRFRAPVWVLPAAAVVLLALVSPLLLKERRVPIVPPLPMPPQKEEARSEPSREAKGEEPASSLPAPAPRALAQPPAPARPPQSPPQEAKKEEGEALPGAPVAPPEAVAGGAKDQSAPAPAATKALNESGDYAVEPSPQGRGAAPAGMVAATEPSPQHATRARLKDGALAARAATAAAGPAAAAAGEARFRTLGARAPENAEDARSLREAWRSFAESAIAGSFADEARVRGVEAAAEAYRFSGSAPDKAAARQDAAAYLARKDAAQTERVRAILESLGP